ncbi:hypothetical protein F53441_9580 [Fusarium austroafricanum]|uniref:Uncharacterized protein n=1 Tax=Fusarium austroafricanum TaxID=2364996 RepID=A0A8H4KD50_9HYPO|nr:hypothetical protein F53441_9580 [Fusarium austroafricanum]
MTTPVPSSGKKGLSYPPLVVEKKRQSNYLPKADILSMIRVNKHFGNIAQPFLFEEIDVGCPGHAGSPSSLALVIRTLLDNPHLADSARHLRFDGNRYHGNSSNATPRTALCGMDLIKATDMIKDTGVQFAKLWTRSVASGLIDGLIALLILLCPNTTSIFLGKNYALNVNYLTMMFDPKLRSQPNVKLPEFKQLQYVTVRNDLSTRATNTFWDFFLLSQLKMLNISGNFPEISSWIPEERPRVMERLRVLNLTRFGETQLSSILALTPNISILGWNHSCRPRQGDDPHTVTIDINVLQDALKPFRRKLTQLDLFADDGTQIEPINSRRTLIRGGPLSLDQFSSLRVVIVPWVFIMGPSSLASATLWDKIPQTVTSLTLTSDLCYQRYWGWTKTTVKQTLREFFRHQSHTKTDLKELYMAGTIFDDMFNSEGLANMKRHTRRFGVELQVIPYTPMLSRHVGDEMERERRFGQGLLYR